MEKIANNQIFVMDQGSGEALTLLPTSFAALDVKERQHLEEWIKNNPEILGEKLLIVTTEYDHFENSNKRLDLLALDQQGKLVVIELKRDAAGTLADLQAIRYAAFCSTLTFDQVVELRANFKSVSDEAAREEIQSFVCDPEWSKLDNRPRIILAAGGFDDQELTSCVLWLRNFEVDISCAEITPYRLSDNRIVLVPRVIIPLPAAKEYMVRVEKKESSGGAQTGGPTSWPEALSKVTNDAVAKFFKKELDANRDNNVNHLDLFFYVAKHRFAVKLRPDFARTFQRGRFNGDVDFWRARLSKPESVQTGSKMRPGDLVRFELYTGEDFANFEKAVQELKGAAWVAADALDDWLAAAQPSRDERVDDSKVVEIDGTDQHWNSYPPDWKPKAGEPSEEAEVLDFDVIPPNG